MAEAGKLKKNLTLFDVYAMSTGAMFSSGLFLLPGIAASYTGDSVWLAYSSLDFNLAGHVLHGRAFNGHAKSWRNILFSRPLYGAAYGHDWRAGLLDCSRFQKRVRLGRYGRVFGALSGASFKTTAIILTVAFAAINIAGAKETTMLQRVLVGTLVVILCGFIVLGLGHVGVDVLQVQGSPDRPFLKSGFIGFISTIGLVFVSYAGLTKVASVAEEVVNPDRNIPLGMTLSLLTATVIYTLGALILIKILPPSELYGSLTPIADAGKVFLSDWPFDMGVILIVVAAMAAFASTGNAGIMSASRYPYAMAKDRLVPVQLSKVGRFGTPTISIVFTMLTMIIVLMLFDVASVAKLASAFQLLLFGLICVAVIVMRESRISTYKPGFRSPLYPWLQIAGILISFWLIIEMGLLAIGFTGMVVIGCVLWYYFYASNKVERRGAIFHIHERLGQQRYEDLEMELMTIIHDRTQSENLSYEALIARSVMMDFRYGKYDMDQIRSILTEQASTRFGFEPEVIETAFADETLDMHPISPTVHISYETHSECTEPELFVLRFGPQASLDVPGASGAHTLLFLITPKSPVGLDLRLAGHLAEIVQSETFEPRWLAAADEKAMNHILMRDDHVLHGPVSQFPSLAAQAGLTIGEIELPASCLIVLIERDGQVMVATPETELRASDDIAVIGEPADIAALEGYSD